MATSISEMVRTSAPATRVDRVAALLFVAALVVPAIALIAGARPAELENSTPAALPPLTPIALTETATYAQVDRFLADALPGRNVAVRAYAGLDYQLLGGSTNRDVIPGVGDWLFFSGELRPTCALHAETLLDEVDTVAGDLHDAGMDFRFVIAPDKHVIHPERWRPGDPIPTPCTDARREAMRAGIAERPASTVDLWAPVEAARAAHPEPIYFSQDSHWTPTGALAAIEALVESIAPGTWDAAEITVDGTSRFPMELARLMGIPRSAVVPAYVVRPSMHVTRATVPTTVHLTNAPDITSYTVGGDGALVPGTTLMVYDSFFNISRPRMVPWFEHTIWVHASDLRDHPELVKDLPKVDRVVVERVERSAYNLDLTRLLAPLTQRTAARP